MRVYRLGEIIEVGYGEHHACSGEIADGGSYFLQIDVDKIEEETIASLFSKEPILYVQVATDEQSVQWAKENKPISSYL